MDLSQYELPSQYIDYSNIHLISDLHFGIRANSLEWLQNQLQFFDEFYIPYLKYNVKPNDILFILGDFFDNRQLLDINVLNASINILIELSNILPIFLLVGNHDCYKKNNTDVNSLRILKYINNVTVFETPTIISNGTSHILILPWIGDKEKEENYAKANSNKAQYIFAHTDITGLKYDNGKIISRGTNLQDINGYKKIFSGHIHKRQEIGHLYYIGSPYHTKRSDVGNQKGIYTFNPNDNTYKFIENNMSSVFQKIKLEDLIEWTLEYASKILENNYTDIIVPDKYIHLFNLTKFIELLKDCKYKKIEVVGEKSKIDDNIAGIIEGENIKDILTLLELSLNDLQLQTETLSKLKLLNKQYYNKASKTDQYN